MKFTIYQKILINKKLISFVALLCVLLLFTDCIRRRRGTDNTTNSSSRVERTAWRSTPPRNTSRGGKTVIKMRVTEGTVVNLHTVTIGNRTLNNVQASIIHNMEAPLLLGQSALAQFGKISIDYKSDKIIFE